MVSLSIFSLLFPSLLSITPITKSLCYIHVPISKFCNIKTPKTFLGYFPFFLSFNLYCDPSHLYMFRDGNVCSNILYILFILLHSFFYRKIGFFYINIFMLLTFYTIYHSFLFFLLIFLSFLFLIYSPIFPPFPIIWTFLYSIFFKFLLSLTHTGTAFLFFLLSFISLLSLVFLYPFLLNCSHNFSFICSFSFVSLVNLKWSSSSIPHPYHSYCMNSLHDILSETNSSLFLYPHSSFLYLHL